MSRISIRDFIPDKCPPISLIKNILQRAKDDIEIEDIKFKVYLLEGETLKKFVDQIQLKLESGAIPLEQEYPVYPPKLKLKYHKRRKALAVDMYQRLGIPYKDKRGRYEHLKRNWSFFGAPIGLLFTMDNAPRDLRQFCYLGSYLQNIMVMLQQNGIDCCAQEAWANLSRTVHKVLNIHEQELLFCGMSVGYKNIDAEVNNMRSERMKIEDFVKLSNSKL